MNTSAIIQKPVLILAGLLVMGYRTYLIAQDNQTTNGAIPRDGARSSDTQPHVQPESKW